MHLTEPFEKICFTKKNQQQEQAIWQVKSAVFYEYPCL